MSNQREPNEMEIVNDEDEIDPMELEFENQENLSNIESKVENYRAILKNPRVDDKAIKIKEQCIYG